MFRIPIVTKNNKKNVKDFQNEIDDIFREESEVKFIIWLDDLRGTLYNSGEGTFTLKNFTKAYNHKEQLFDVKQGKNVEVEAKKCDAKLKMGSHEFKDSRMSLEVEIYLIMDKEKFDKIDFEEYDKPRELSVLHPIVG